MPIDQILDDTQKDPSLQQSNHTTSSLEFFQPYVDPSNSNIQINLEDLKEPPVAKLSVGDEIRGFFKEKFGKITGNRLLEKEGQALEKAAHPVRDREKASENFERIYECKRRSKSVDETDQAHKIQRIIPH